MSKLRSTFAAFQSITSAPRDTGLPLLPSPSVNAVLLGRGADTPCALSVSNFDLAEHAFSSSIDPLGNYFSYHSSQLEPDGVNDASVNNEAIDASLDAIRTSVDFVAIKAGHEVTIVEINAERVHAAQKLGEPAGAKWVVADACERLHRHARRAREVRRPRALQARRGQ